jgi:small subunit ribosomal protein S27Ae
MAKKVKEPKRKGKKQRKGKKHMSLKPHEYYDVSGGDVKRNRNPCPRCGPGNWLANHKGRVYCGKCGYTEFEKKPGESPPEEKPLEVKEEKQEKTELEKEKPSETQE